MPSIKQRISAAVAAFKSGGNFPRRVNFQAPRSGARSYAAAQYDRLTEDFLAPLSTADSEMRTRLRTLRGRARELERNEPYTIRFLTSLENNIYDHNGIAFRARAGELSKDPATGDPIFRFDKTANLAIQMAWEEWKKNPFVSKDMTLNEGGRLALRTTARDGDPLVKFVIDPKYNDSLAIQLLEPDVIDDNRNESLVTSTTQIRMGVEVVNGTFEQIAYWLLETHPGDYQWWSGNQSLSIRHDAADFLHLMKKKRTPQVRDVPWLVGIMRDLNMLDGYDEAAIVAARTGAAKMGFFTRDPNSPGPAYTGESVDQNGNPIDPAMGGDKTMDAEPGLIEDLSQSPGLRFEAWEPDYPHQNYADFIRARIRRIGAGLNISYHTLANDLTEVNFSSIRAGVLDDRENYKATQTWWIDHFERPIFLRWLEIKLLTGTLVDPFSGKPLPFAKLKKFSRHEFRGRRWPWVDPLKDVQADVMAINNRLKSREDVIAESGEGDFDETIAKIAKENQQAENLGVELPAIGASQPSKAGDDEEDGGPPRKPSRPSA